MARIQISRDLSGRIIVSFPYDPPLVEKVKSIDGRRWHPEEKHWSFPKRSLPSPSMGEGEGGGEEVRIGAVPEVETKSLGKIMSPLDTLVLGKGGDE